MKKKKIKVIYIGFNPKLDKKIIDALVQVGFTWYAQGIDQITNERDICFKYEVL